MTRGSTPNPERSYVNTTNVQVRGLPGKNFKVIAHGWNALHSSISCVVLFFLCVCVCDLFLFSPPPFTRTPAHSVCTHAHAHARVQGEDGSWGFV